MIRSGWKRIGTGQHLARRRARRGDPTGDRPGRERLTVASAHSLPFILVESQGGLNRRRRSGSVHLGVVAKSGIVQIADRRRRSVRAVVADQNSHRYYPFKKLMREFVNRLFVPQW